MNNVSQQNIFPVFDEILQQKDKELLLKQHAKVVWMTGLSGSGKTTIAIGVEKALFKKGFLTQIIDGDNVRTGINNNLGFSEEDRTENIRRIGEISKLFVQCGIITINCFVSPTIAMRAMAKNIIGADNFIEVYIDTPLSVCEKRDTKGLYQKARKGEIKDFTGIDAPFEPPTCPNLTIHTEGQDVSQSIQEVLDYLLPIIHYK